MPATGCAGTKCTPAGTRGPTSRITDCLVDPTSVSTAPGSRCGAIAAAMAANAPTGAHSITQSAPSTARADIRLDPIGKPQFPHPVQRLRGACVHHHLARQIAPLPRDAGDGAADQPDADQRQAAKQRLRHS